MQSPPLAADSPQQPSRTSSTTSRSGSGSVSAATLDSTITRLLIATKGLLEGLAQWSRGEVGADYISSIYVKLGNDFNVACTAFSKENISMTCVMLISFKQRKGADVVDLSELLSVPGQLRACLEQCLSDTPSQSTLERHLPQVRQIIIGLLTGLREKQKQYREGVVARRAREGRSASERRPTEDSYRTVYDAQDSASSVSGGPARSQSIGAPPITPNSAARARDQLRNFVGQAQSQPTPPPSLSASASSSKGPPPSAVPTYPLPTPGAPAGSSRTRESDPARRGTAREAVPDRSSSVRDPSTRGLSQASDSGSQRDSSRSSKTSLNTSEGPTLSTSRSSGSLATTTGNWTSNRFSGGDRPQSPPPPHRQHSDPDPMPSTPITDIYPQAQSPTSAPAPEIALHPPSQAPSHRVTSSVDEPYTPTFDTSQSAKQIEAVESLKASDQLSRRASKRFSHYAMNKITTGSTGSSPSRQLSMDMAGRELAHSKGGGLEDKRILSHPRKTKSEFRPAKGADGERRMPPMPSMPSSSSLSDYQLHELPTVEEDEFHAPLLSDMIRSGSPDAGSPTPSKATSAPSGTHSRNASASLPSALPTLISQSPSFLGAESRPAVVPAVSIDPPPAPASTASSRGRMSIASDAGEAEPDFPIAIYLQIGRDVKKARLEEVPTVAALRALFIEKFQYNPGHSDFPNIYLRDPIVGIQYELEDMSEVKNGSVISLNIDSVEQVKQHIDEGLSGLTQEIKELRSTVTAMRRASVSAATAAAMLSSPDPNSPSLSRPSERQFQDAAQKVLRIKRGSVSDITTTPTPTPAGQLARVAETDDIIAPASPTSSTSGDLRAPHVVEALKNQHEEVQNLRHEISVLRQIYVDFTGQTKSLLANVRTQTSHVQTLAATKVSTARAFIEAGKVKLESVTTDLIARGDTVQDLIDDMRSDVSVRKIRPRPQQIAEIAASLKSVTKERDELTSWIATVKPSWKTTWSDELETIISEQKLLELQEGLLSELQADLEDATKIFTTIQEVVQQPKLRSAVRDFTSTTSNDGQSGLSSVLLEVQGVQPDAERRLEAIARAEKAREVELASRTDEFADELGGFVAGGKLKKAGGIEEAERIRQLKSEATLKAMFSS